MAEYFDICGTHIPMASIKDYRTIKVEFVFRPVFRETKKSMMTALSGKKYEFAFMEPYAAIIGQQGHKSELGEYKAKDFKEALGKDIRGRILRQHRQSPPQRREEPSQRIFRQEYQGTRR